MKKTKKPQKLWQSVQFILAAAGILLLTHWWQQSNRQGEQLFTEQSTILMRETLKALAQTCAYLIENDQLEGLKALTQQMATNPYLHDVVVYDANGVRLAESSDSDPARLLYAPQTPDHLLPMVQEIYQGEQRLGYIKISLKQHSSFDAVSKSWHALMEQMAWMLAFAALLATMLRSSLQALSHALASNKELRLAAIDSMEHQPSHSMPLVAAETPADLSDRLDPNQMSNAPAATEQSTAISTSAQEEHSKPLQ